MAAKVKKAKAKTKPPLAYFWDLRYARERVQDLQKKGWPNARWRHSLLVNTPKYVVDAGRR